MGRLLAFTGVLVVCVAIFAYSVSVGVLTLQGSVLDYSDRGFKYTDGPFSPEERIAVSLLTNLNVLQGNPDGTFEPKRLVNRAEFLKVALLSHPTVKPSLGDKRECFPDVVTENWFSPYACYAKEHGIVQGYLDGRFHPEKFVTYAEALKVLVGLYEYEVVTLPGEQWYRPYVRAAILHGTVLLDLLPPGYTLSRGEVALLVAAFRTEHEGELSLYRETEVGKVVGDRGQGTNDTEFRAGSGPDGGQQSSALTEEPDTVGVLSGLPSRSHLLLLGEETPPLADGLFSATTAGLVRLAVVKLEREVKSLRSLSIVDGLGVPVGTLALDSSDTDKRTWKGEFDAGSAYSIPKDTTVVLALKGVLKGRGEWGRVEELVEVDHFAVTLQAEGTGESWEVLPKDQHVPQHQTVQAKLTRVERGYGATGELRAGEGRILAAFDFFGETLPGTEIVLKALTFSIESTGVKILRWELAGSERLRRYGCGVRTEMRNTIDCSVPSSVGTLTEGSHTLYLFGDISLEEGAKNPSLQVFLRSPGSMGQEGAVRWSDETGEYNWIEGEEPVAEGTVWK